MGGLATLLPVTTGTQYTLWELYSQLYEMFNERFKPFGCGNFPDGGGLAFYGPTTLPYRTIGSITDNEDGTVTIADSGSPGWTTNQFAGTKHTDECPNAPLFYDIVIFGNLGPPLDPYTVVRLQIGSNNTTSVTCSPANVLYNAVTAKFITSISSLDGKPYQFVQRGFPSFVDRRILRPNDQESWVGSFSNGWSATYSSGTGKFSFTSSPYYPVTVFYAATSSSHKIAGTLTLNADGSFSNGIPGYASSGGTNTSTSFDPSIWNGVTFNFATATYDPASGIGQLQQFQNLVATSPYDNATTTTPPDPIQPPYTAWKTDQFKGMELIAYDNAGGVDTVIPNPATLPAAWGYGYTSVPTVSFSGGGGSGAAATAVLGTIKNVAYIRLTNAGSGYSSVPLVTVTVTPSAGTCFATATLDGSGHVASIAVTLSSTGITAATVTVAAPGGSGTTATAAAVLGTQIISSYNVTNAGKNYSSAPTVTVSGGGGTGASPIATLDGSSKLLIRATVAGNDANVIYLGKKPTDSGYLIPSSPLNLDDGQEFIIVAAGLKGMPGRYGDPLTRFYAGILQDYITHFVDDALNSVGKMAAGTQLQTESDDGTSCVPNYYYTQDIDVTYPWDFCNCYQEGMPIAPDLYKTWRGLQAAALGLVQLYVNPSTLGQSTPPQPYNLTTALAAIGGNSAGLNRVWRRRFRYLYGKGNFIPDVDVDANGNPYLIDPPQITPGGDLVTPAGITLTASLSGGAATSGLNNNVTYYYQVSQYNGSGETLACSAVSVTTPYPTFCGVWSASTTYAINDCVSLIPVYNGGTSYFLGDQVSYDDGDALLNYQCIVSTVSSEVPSTAGAVNSTYWALLPGGIYAAIKAGMGQQPPNNSYWTLFAGRNKCSVLIQWPSQDGASGANIYGRGLPTGGYYFMLGVPVPALSYLDDGSITPNPSISPPATNTTHNACLGAGTWIYRPPSTAYLGRTNQGFVNDSTSLVAGDYARYMGDNAADPFDGRGGATQQVQVDSYAWDRFFRGRYHKDWWLARLKTQMGTITDGNLYSFTDSSQHWWTDNYNTGTLRIQGGTASSGGSTSLVVSSITGQALCWWNANRYINYGGIYTQFILEIYKGGLPAGWSLSADGTATYSAPSPPGHSGTAGTTPTISAVGPSAGIWSTGQAQTVWFDGNYFDPACTGVLTNTTTGVSHTLTFSSVSYGEVVTSFNFGNTAATWSLVITNPGPHASSAFTFTTHAVYRVPITSGTISSGTGTLGFGAVSGLVAASGDGGLIREPSYETNKWKQRMVKITRSDNTVFTIPARYSDDQWIYFDTQGTAFQAGWTYEIFEYMPGPVLQMTTSPPSAGRNYVESIPGSVYWSEPFILDSSGNIVAGSNTDSRGGGDFLKDLNFNLETKVTGYGLWMAGDDFSADIPNQVYELLQLCKKTIGGGGCTPYSSIANLNSNTPDKNGGANAEFTAGVPWSVYFGTAYSTAWANAVTAFDSIWASALNPSTVAGCPYVSIVAFVDAPWQSADPSDNGKIEDIQAGSQYAYMMDSGIPNCLTCNVSWYVYSMIDGSDTAPGTSSVWPDEIESAFDAQGTSLAWHTYSLVGSVSSGGQTEIIGPRLGSLFTTPPTLTKPTDPYPYSVSPGYAAITTTRGYYVADVVAIRDWSGAFLYT